MHKNAGAEFAETVERNLTRRTRAATHRKRPSDESRAETSGAGDEAEDDNDKRDGK